jgi:hypothetical protein
VRPISLIQFSQQIFGSLAVRAAAIFTPRVEASAHNLIVPAQGTIPFQLG